MRARLPVDRCGRHWESARGGLGHRPQAPEACRANVGDVSPDGKAVLWKDRLGPKITKGGRSGVAFLVAGVRGRESQR